MAGGFTKTAARNIFYGGSASFFILFLILTWDSYNYIIETGTDESTLTESVVAGKRIWEEHACVNCHTILGEGAYFAPELGNVWIRYGGPEDPEGARESLIAWMQSMPTGIEGRRQMPQFNLTDKELNELIDFFEWTSRINTQNWPPNEAG